MKRMLKENFEFALRIAIDKRTETEKSWGYTGESAFLAGMKSILKASQEGEEIVIRAFSIRD